MPRAIVLGGNGQVGAAAALRLAADGWEVTASGRPVRGSASGPWNSTVMATIRDPG